MSDSYEKFVGNLFHGLRIESVLGEGNMGVTFLASHPILRTVYVLKMFKAQPAVDLFREAHLAARVISPNVVPVVDAGFEGQMPFLVHQHVDGVDLMEIVEWMNRQGRRIPAGIACGIIAGIASGLHAVNQAGVVHSDVKPHNIFIRGSGTPVLGDFGLAVDYRKFEAAGGEATHGTPSFKPPEQWTGDLVTRESDIYALGATAFLVLRGELPFSGNTVDELRSAHVERTFVPPPSRTARESFALWAITKMLAKDPKNRFSNAETVAELFRFVARETIPYLTAKEDSCWFGNLEITLRHGDITTSDHDVLVIEATPGLAQEPTLETELARAVVKEGGGAVADGIASQAAVALGDVIWVDSGDLSAGRLACAVASNGGSACVQRCILRTLFQADVEGARHVALPPLAVMTESVAPARCAQLTLEALRTFAAYQPRHLHRVDVVVPSKDDLEIWNAHLRNFTSEGLQESLDEIGPAS